VRLSLVEVRGACRLSARRPITTSWGIETSPQKEALVALARKTRYSDFLPAFKTANFVLDSGVDSRLYSKHGSKKKQ